MSSHDTRVAWFGKHPAWRDFMPQFENPAAAQPLRDWVKSGRDFLHKLAPAGDELSGCLYLLSLRHDKLTYCGVIGPSRDGGEPARRFPLTIYVPLARRRYRRAYALLPAYAAHAWEEMRVAQQKCLAHDDGTEVQRVLDGVAVSIPAAGWGAWRRFRRDVATVGSADFLATLHPDGDGAAVDLIARMAGAIAPFRDGRLGPPALAFELPVSEGLKTAAYQAAFWLHFCESGLGKLAGEPSIFLRPSPGGRRLVLFLREPEPADYALVLAGLGDDQKIHRFDGGAPLPAEALRAAAGEAAGNARSVADLFACRWDRLLRLAP